MINVSLKVDTKAISSWLDSRPAAIEKTLERILQKAAYQTEREAKTEAPVQTGRLRASIFTDIMGLKAEIAPTVNYAEYVHEGTRFIRANPFMDRAGEKMENVFQDIVADEIENALK